MRRVRVGSEEYELSVCSAQAPSRSEEESLTAHQI